MKKLTSLLISCSLALAGAALAQEPVEQPSPSKGKSAPEKTHATQPQPGANAAKPQERRAKQAGAVKERGATKEPGATNQPGAEKGRKTHADREPANAPETNVPAKSPQTTNAESSPATETNAAQQQQQPGGKKGRHGRNANPETGAGTATTASPDANQQMEQGRKGRKGRGEKAASAPTSLAPAPATTGAAATSATGTNTNAATTQGTVGRGGKKVEAHQIQQIKQQHANFRAQPKPEKVVAVTFNQNYRIEAAQQWQGPRYEVFRSYHPEWHDQGWYRSRYTRVELIGGGWYFWNSGYWYPAWGYDPGVAYYVYDGPIYVGHRAVPPDQVIADVQAELQQMGYYEGEVDGLLGPLTRQALRDYQADHGLIVTEVIDEPTLEALELA